MPNPDSASGRSRYAAIDLGTNTCLLLIADWDGKRLAPLAQEMRVVRLGAGVGRTGLLSEEAMARAETAFREYREIIDAHHCRQVSCVSTSAFREATNAESLRARIEAATGYELTAITGAEEAALVLLAVQHAFTAPSGNRVIVDVGGGSTELILEHSGEPTGMESLPLGSVRLTERWFRGDPPAQEELAAASGQIEAVLAASKLETRVDTLVAVGGTATTFVAMDQQLDAYDHASVHGASLPSGTVRQILDRCLALPTRRRTELPGLHPGRAEVIIAGGMILNAVMERFGQAEALVSDQGLRWGALLEMALGAAKDRATGPPPAAVGSTDVAGNNP
ncbi:MAG: Ppx/GppA phosphatase family protein [Candidatus Neomarinimicrobiota bacterium]